MSLPTRTFGSKNLPHSPSGCLGLRAPRHSLRWEQEAHERQARGGATLPSVCCGDGCGRALSSVSSADNKHDEVQEEQEVASGKAEDMHDVMVGPRTVCELASALTPPAGACVAGRTAIRIPTASAPGSGGTGPGGLPGGRAQKLAPVSPL